MTAMEVTMEGVREYCEERQVEFDHRDGRPVVRATNEAGHNCTEVDLLDLIAWIKANRPELLA